MTTKCLITGCALQKYGDTESYAWGDLHMQGNRLIFNAVTDSKTGETVWFSHDPARERLDKKRLHIPVGCDYFERRGVFVVSADPILLSREAIERIKREDDAQAMWPEFKQKRVDAAVEVARRTAMREMVDKLR